MVEAARDNIESTVTNYLGFEPIQTPRTSLQSKPNVRVYDRKIDLYFHLAVMDFMTTEDPSEENDIKNFIDATLEWRNQGLPRLGLSDFDVKRPEELIERVSEFKRRGPLVRTQTQYVKDAQVPDGHFSIRTDLAYLAAGVLVALIPATHTDAFAQSEERTTENLRGACIELLSGLQSVNDQDLKSYKNFAAYWRFPDVEDNNFVEKCTDTARGLYNNTEDLGKIVTDGDRMFRYAFISTLFGGAFTALLGTYMLAAKGISKLTSPKKRPFS